MTRTNSEILQTPPQFLRSLEKQDLYVLQHLSTKMPCPNCGHKQSYIEALGETIDSYNTRALHSDDCPCLNCGRRLRYTVPFIAVSNCGWIWVLIPVEVLSKDELEKRIRAHGYDVRYVEYCEDSRTPGFLGQIAGVCDHNVPEVKIGLKANPTPEQLLATLRHELRHLDEPDWDCGNRDVFGRGGKPKQ